MQTSLFDLDTAPAPVRAVAPTGYVDPYPGRKGSETVREDCACGDGVYKAPSGIAWERIVDGKKIADTWCFRCNGVGYFEYKVSTIRARVRRQAKAAAQRATDAKIHAVRAWLAAEQEYQRERERVAALVQGYVAEIGERVKDLSVTVVYAGTFEAANPRGYGAPVDKALVIFEAEDGKILKTSGTGSTLYNLAKGDKVTITATVKAHGEYREQDQTVLTRVKVTRTGTN